MNKEQILAAIDGLPQEEREATLSQLSDAVVAPNTQGSCPVGYYKGADGNCYKDPITNPNQEA